MALKSDFNFSDREEIGIDNGDIVYVKIKKATEEKSSFSDWDDFLAQFKIKLPLKNVVAIMIDYRWNLIQQNS